MTFELAEKVSPLSQQLCQPSNYPFSYFYQLMCNKPDIDILEFFQQQALTFTATTIPFIYSFSGDICFKFSAFCLCSVGLFLLQMLELITKENYHKNEQTLPLYVF